MKKEIVHGFETQGNNGGNYLQIGRFESDDNRLFIEVGDCCVVTFRGIVTVEVLTNFLTQLSFDDNAGLLQNLRKRMAWSEDVNDKYFEPCKELGYFEKPFLNNLMEIIE